MTAASLLRGFQSTLPARGATNPRRSANSESAYFNPRSPRGERPYSFVTVTAALSIFQSTLPARGATPSEAQTHWESFYFNPRSPRGERPYSFVTVTAALSNFNPRSPRGERLDFVDELISPRHFNPRSPRGERHASAERAVVLVIFQSTLPARGATI